jgi:hypothetical protein
MDVLATEDGLQYLKHHLLDFGSILGSRGDRPKEPWIGHQNTIAHKESVARAVTLGFYVPRWERSDYPKLRGVGLFDAWSFDPLEWKPEVPNPAFLMKDRADAFWAAKQVAAFTDAEIRAIVETGQLSDPRAADWIADCLIKRRDRIAQAWYSKVLALDRFRVADGRLEWVDLSADYGLGAVPELRIRWATFDNERETSEEIPGENSARLPEMRGDGYWMALLESPERPRESVRVYLRKRGELAQIVGVDRTW